MTKVAIVGAGAVAGLHAKAVASLDGVTLCAVSDPLPGKADALAAAHGATTYRELDDMLDREEIDVVILSLPTFLHAEYVERCAARGINILCEKPIEMSLEDARKVVASAENHGVALMVAQVVRFWPGYVDLKRMYDAGELGDVLMASFSRSSTVPARGGWIIDPDKGRGAIQDMHIHDIDFASYLFGPAERVYSHAVRDYTGCFDHVVSNVTFRNGIKAVAEAAFTPKNTYPFSTSFRVCGTDATAEYSYRASPGNTTANVQAQLQVFRQDSPVENVVVADYDPYARQLEYFVDRATKKLPIDVVPLADSLRSISLLDAVRASAASERIETVVQV